MSDRSKDSVALAVTFDDGNVLIIPCKNPPFLITLDSPGWVQFQTHRRKIVQLRVPTTLDVVEGVPVIYPDPDARLHD